MIRLYLFKKEKINLAKWVPTSSIAKACPARAVCRGLGGDGGGGTGAHI